MRLRMREVKLGGVRKLGKDFPQDFLISVQEIITQKTKQNETDGRFVGIPTFLWNGKDAEFRFVSYKTECVIS